MRSSPRLRRPAEPITADRGAAEWITQSAAGTVFRTFTLPQYVDVG